VFEGTKLTIGSSQNPKACL